MQTARRTARKGFTLVELLAVVLILAVIAAVAVPSYLNTRKVAAAKTCKSNIAAIASAEAAYAVRFGKYNTDATAGTASATVTAYVPGAAGVAPTGGLVGAPEGLAEAPHCPLDGTTAYLITAGTTTVTAGGGTFVAGAGNDAQIRCPNDAQHATDTGSAATTWQKNLKAAGTDTTNPL